MLILYRMLIKKSSCKMVVLPDFLPGITEEARYLSFEPEILRLFLVFPLRNPSRACILVE